MNRRDPAEMIKVYENLVMTSLYRYQSCWVLQSMYPNSVAK